MTRESDPRGSAGSRAPGRPGLYLLLVILPLGLAGVSGDLIRARHARSLAVAEAGQMARLGLGLARAGGPDAALRTLEGVVGYEAAFYREGERQLATDPGFGPATLDPGIRTLEVEGRLGVVEEGPELDLLAARSSPRPLGSTYPGGRWALAVLTLALVLVGLGVLSSVRAPGTARLIVVTGVPVLLAWGLLAGAAWQASRDAEAASGRGVGLVSAVARDLGSGTPPETLARLTGLRAARLENGELVAASWQDPGLASEVRGLPRPPESRTITGYLTTGEERLRYAASRFAGGTTVFLAPAPELPPRTAALRLLLVGLGVTAAGAAFVVLARKI